MPILCQHERHWLGRYGRHAPTHDDGPKETSTPSDSQQKLPSSTKRKKRIPVFDPHTLPGRLGEYFCLPLDNRWKPIASPSDFFAYRFLKSKGTRGTIQLAVKPGSDVLLSVDALTHYCKLTELVPDVCRVHLVLPIECCRTPSRRHIFQPFLGWTCVSDKSVSYAREFNRRSLQNFMDTVVGSGVIDHWPSDARRIGLCFEWSLPDFIDEVIRTIDLLDSGNLRSRLDEVRQRLHWVISQHDLLFTIQQVHELFRSLVTIKLLSS